MAGNRHGHRIWLRAAALAVTAAWIAFILLRSMKSGPQSHAESTAVRGFLARLLPRIDHHLLRKSAHFLEYLVLGGLLAADFRLFGRRSLLPPMGCGLLVAASDELLQRFVPARSGELMDVLLDFSGVAAGCLLLAGAAALRRRRKGRRDGP